MREVKLILKIKIPNLLYKILLKKDHKSCNSCGRMNYKFNNYCKYCGKPIPK